MDHLRVWHPIPLEGLDMPLALQENSDILKVFDAITDIENGVHTPDQWHAEVQRWLNHVPALYDRYEKSLRYLRDQCGVDVLDQWQHEPFVDGADVVYPDDSQEFIFELWAAILVRGTVMEY